MIPYALWWILLALAGAAFRLAPLLDQGGRLLRQFPTEDGYLMLTIARNLGMGLGMSTAGGTLPTNGTQPLSTLVWALCFAVVGGDKRLGVLLVLILSVLVAAAAGYLVYRVGRLILPGPAGETVSRVAAALWFVAPVGVKHSMNCLESGLYVLLVLATVLAFLHFWNTRPSWNWPCCLVLGFLLGLVFWARNDGVFFVLAVCLVRLLAGGRAAWPARLREVLIFGACSVLVAGPWLVLNQLRFGHIMPISGQAESMEAAFASNLRLLPAALAEYILVVVQIPAGLETHPAVLAFGLLLLGALIVWLYRRRADLTPLARLTVAVVAIYGLCLCTFYGFWFGAGHFVSRYLYPLSPFLALAAVGLVAAQTATAPAALLRRMPSAALAAALILSVGLNARIYRQGHKHRHFQVVEWVDRNVGPETWVGAIQSGTLGYFHDHTINLDGKVNPEALAARKRGAVLEYVVQSDIQVLADWSGITRWARSPALSSHFVVLVNDDKANLGVLRRAGGDPAVPDMTGAAPEPGASRPGQGG